MRAVTSLWLWSSLALAGACAAPLPSWEGGSTTPQSRSDIALGGAAQVPVGTMRNTDPAESGYRDQVSNGGVVPVGALRYGLDRGYDIGLLVAGPVVRLDLRRELVLSNGSTRKALVFALAPFGGAIVDDDEQGSGMRVGAEARAAYGADVGGLYDAWVGLRLGVEHARGDFALAGVSVAGQGTALRAGLMLGLAVGFRRLHAFAEVTAWAEGWIASHGEIDLNRFGLVLTPSFGLRLRI